MATAGVVVAFLLTPGVGSASSPEAARSPTVIPAMLSSATDSAIGQYMTIGGLLRDEDPACLEGREVRVIVALGANDPAYELDVARTSANGAFLAIGPGQLTIDYRVTVEIGAEQREGHACAGFDGAIGPPPVSSVAPAARLRGTDEIRPLGVTGDQVLSGFVFAKRPACRSGRTITSRRLRKGRPSGPPVDTIRTSRHGGWALDYLTANPYTAHVLKVKAKLLPGGPRVDCPALSLR